MWRGCRTGYENHMGEKEAKKQKLGENSQQNKNIPVFRLPKDSIQLEKWKRTIRKSDLEVKSDTVICEKHWPVGYKKTRSKVRYFTSNFQ